MFSYKVKDRKKLFVKFSFFLTATGVQLQVVQDGIHQWLQFFSSCICSLPPYPLCSHLPLLLPCPSLSSPVYGFLLQFHIFIVQFFLSPLLLPSASCLQSQSLPSFSASLPCSAPESFLDTVLLLLCKTWAPLRGDSCSPVCVQPSIRSHTGPDRSLFCTQEGWSLGTEAQLPMSFCTLGREKK